MIFGNNKRYLSFLQTIKDIYHLCKNYLYLINVSPEEDQDSEYEGATFGCEKKAGKIK